MSVATDVRTHKFGQDQIDRVKWSSNAAVYSSHPNISSLVTVIELNQHMEVGQAEAAGTEAKIEVNEQLVGRRK